MLRSTARHVLYGCKRNMGGIERKLLSSPLTNEARVRTNCVDCEAVKTIKMHVKVKPVPLSACVSCPSRSSQKPKKGIFKINQTADP